MVNAICKNPRVKWIYTRNEAGSESAVMGTWMKMMSGNCSQMVCPCMPSFTAFRRRCQGCEGAKQISRPLLRDQDLAVSSPWQANASLMAAAYAKLTGRLAVCVATSGPGASNLTTGLLDALQDQCSMVAITGLKPRAGIGYSDLAMTCGVFWGHSH